MNNKKMIELFKKKAQKTAGKRKDLRFQKTMGFLKAKGLLDTNLPIQPMRSLRLDVADALWAAQNVEPRILEVLPAAILHFPKNVIGFERCPEDFKFLVDRIGKNEPDGPDYAGIEFKKMKFWANVDLKDRRTKPIKNRRRMKAFRLMPETLKRLADLVRQGRFTSQTEALEAAVLALGKQARREKSCT